MYIHTPPPNIEQLSTKNVDNRRWYITPSGNYYPSITTVLSAKPKQAILDWQASVGGLAAKIETERASARGNSLHLMCERFLNNDPNPTADQDDSYIKLFNQLKHSLKRVNNIRMQEQALYSDTLYVAGRVDVIAEYAGVVSVIDFKTSNNSKDDNMIEDYFIQETFYALAYKEMYGEPIDQIITIMAVEKTGFPLVWKRPIDPYIPLLKSRIDEFYQSLSEYK